MKDTDPKASETPRLLDTLIEDFRQKGHLKERRREWKELQEFYLTDNQKEQLKNMGHVKAWFWKIGWILRSMLLRLSPFRRVLVFISVLLVSTSPMITFNSHSGEISGKIHFAFILLFTVILLELKDKLLARDELEAGRKIQQALMPEHYPQVEGWQIMLFTQSANEVGGDLVDFLKIDPRRISISLADISGKGLHAALLMSKLQATIRALTSSELSIENLVSCVNDIFHRDTPPSIFASLLYVELTPASDILHFINAGHFPPIVFHGNDRQDIPKGELGIGLQAGTKYIQRKMRLAEGDVFIGYSDGITEARNESGDFYGIDRLKKILPPIISLSAQKIGNFILQDIKRFVGDAPINDDMSLIVLKRG
jgi:hypothetical protein